MRNRCKTSTCFIPWFRLSLIINYSAGDLPWRLSQKNYTIFQPILSRLKNQSIYCFAGSTWARRRALSVCANWWCPWAPLKNECAQSLQAWYAQRNPAKSGTNNSIHHCLFKFKLAEKNIIKLIYAASQFHPSCFRIKIKTVIFRCELSFTGTHSHECI